MPDELQTPVTASEQAELLQYVASSMPGRIVNIFRRMAFELGARRERERWISVTERMPEAKQWVLLIALGETHIGFWRGDNAIDAWAVTGGGSRSNEMVTHWRALPEPPKESADAR